MSGLYSFTGNSASNSYDFQTDAGIDVNVYFYPADYIFPKYTSFKDSVYHFGINTSERIKNDSRVKRTVIFIIYSHFVSKPDSVLLYACDNMDGLQVHRKRKFNGWFLQNKDSEYTKLDTDIVDNDDSTKRLFVSIIFHKQNRHSEEIAHAFDSLESDFPDKDTSVQED